MSETTIDDVKEYILSERAAGNVVVWRMGQLASMPLDQFVSQPADGILYDLNRLEEVCLTFIDDRKWVNDFAAAQVIRKLIKQRDDALGIK